MKKILKPLLILLIISQSTAAQTYSPAELVKLRKAERTADLFIERFRQTLDFGIVWKEFRSKNYRCRVAKSALISSISDREKLKIGKPTLEKAYVVFLNGYFLSSAHMFSLVPLNLEGSKADRLTAEYVKRLGLSKYLDDQRKEPRNARELAEFICQSQKAARILRRKMPPEAMKNDVWKANQKYLTSHEGRDSQGGIREGNDDFCLSNGVKIYTIDKGVFFFYIAEEKGKMKVLDFGIGN